MKVICSARKLPFYNYALTPIRSFAPLRPTGSEHYRMHDHMQDDDRRISCHTTYMCVGPLIACFFFVVHEDIYNWGHKLLNAR